ncbi:hypothetical protein JX266_012871 [Neoarthrinium moseri]|uniref:uncharacterized protein n=1 Tax=Neoarthrinium moseri TaxID=1658444 RepID=UPI001FDC0766|nr:uncharacterized protein JN550_003846 [Neoarthrinium moseri]KAI1840935.1 hypothetical protein JX266_012871 [Neoarthrinium moseri]KAI1872972.1 hypothetical protein JN550_003846 [Neoarthrinium moseri]
MPILALGYIGSLAIGSSPRAVGGIPDMRDRVPGGPTPTASSPRPFYLRQAQHRPKAGPRGGRRGPICVERSNDLSTSVKEGLSHRAYPEPALPALTMALVLPVSPIEVVEPVMETPPEIGDELTQKDLRPRPKTRPMARKGRKEARTRTRGLCDPSVWMREVGF